jgi:hypothetical protein
MKHVQKNSRIPADLMAELQDAAEKLARGERDLEAAKQSAQRMDRMREENRSLFGVQNIGVDIIRQIRESRIPQDIRPSPPSDDKKNQKLAYSSRNSTHSANSDWRAEGAT